MVKTVVAALIVTAGTATAAQALEFQPLGPEALGLGGAGVARTYGALAPYWNPAGLAFAPKSGSIALGAGAGAMIGGKLAQSLDGISGINFSPATPAEEAASEAGLVGLLSQMAGKGNYVRATANAEIGIQAGHFGTGVFTTVSAGATPNSDTTNIAFPTESNPLPANPFLTDEIDMSNGNLLGITIKNASTVTVRGLALAEVPLAYGWQIDAGSAGKIGVGASVKYLYGEATSSTRSIFRVDGTSVSGMSSHDLSNDLTKQLKSSSNWGLDLGALWKPTLPMPTTVGVIGKNLNAPTFATSSGEKLRVDRQIRAGFSTQPCSWLEVAADVDVLANPTLTPGVKTQHLGGGLELAPASFFKVRVGGYTDLATASDGAVTAGLSLGAPWLRLDLDAAYGLGVGRYDNTSYPTETKVQFTLSSSF